MSTEKIFDEAVGVEDTQLVHVVAFVHAVQFEGHAKNIIKIN